LLSPEGDIGGFFATDRCTAPPGLEWKKDFNAEQIEKLAKQERAKLLRK
jgi:hypothetical protein